MLTEGEEVEVRKSVQSTKLLSQFIPSFVCCGLGLTMHQDAGTFEDEGCRFIMVHGEKLKH